MSRKTLWWMVALLAVGLALIGLGTYIWFLGQWWGLAICQIGGSAASLGGYQTYQERKFIREMEK